MRSGRNEGRRKGEGLSSHVKLTFLAEVSRGGVGEDG